MNTAEHLTPSSNHSPIAPSQPKDKRAGDSPHTSESWAPLPGMIGVSAPMKELAKVVRRTARLAVPVLLRGESGSGKELAARALHSLSPRSRGPFVAVNGASLTDTMAASALFGHVRGAFTGAMLPRLGAFRQAEGGTLFIDEVAAIPHATQALLLRALEDFLVIPVGGDEGTTVDVRVITATCEDLEIAVRKGVFRGDLYQRVATCVVRIPPLRKRSSDIRDLAADALADVLPEAHLGADAAAVLESYDFPGNVRELRNIILQAAISSERRVITAEHLARVMSYRLGGVDPDRAPPTSNDAELLALFDHHQGNLSKAARLAGLPRSTFRDRIRRERRRRRSIDA